ncbi:MAG: type VI secretion system baseplate subunit TssK [Gammaproteobacteria bacterium]
MTWNNKVVWAEGMFLRPAHFQQHVRYLENMVERRTSNLRSHPWGFTSLKLDRQLLSLGKIGIAEAQGVFADGTPFSVPDEDDAPPPLEVGDSVRNSIVFLGLPTRRFSAAEMGARDDRDALTRCLIHEAEVVDTHAAQGSSALLQVGKLNLRLFLEKDNHPELVAMGVARIVEVREDRNVVLDDAFLAPVLDCQAVSSLFGLVKELQGLLHHRGEALAGRVTEAGRGGVSEIADFLLLQVVNRYEPLVAHLATRGTLHPEIFYSLCVELAGELATFTSPKKRPPEFPPYRHEDPQVTFAPVVAELRRSLSMVLETNAVRIPLEERKFGIRVGPIVDRTLLKNSQFVLAVHAKIPTEELRRRFPTQVKIGPVEQIRQLVNVQLPGIVTRPLPVAPRQLPYQTGYVYFELDRSSEFWAGLETSGGFALHVSGEFPGLQLELWAIRG